MAWVKMYASDTEKFSSSLSIDRGGLGVSRWHRGGHVKPKKSESAGLASKRDSPNYPDFPGKTGIYRSHLGKGEAANRVLRCDLSFDVLFGGGGEKAMKKRSGGEVRRAREEKTR